MSTEKKTKKAFVIRDFRDSGDERNFAASEAGDPKTFPEIEEGAFNNYKAAGLVREPTGEDLRAPAPVPAPKPAA